MLELGAHRAINRQELKLKLDRNQINDWKYKKKTKKPAQQ